MSKPVAHSVSVVSSNYNNGAFLEAYFQSIIDSSVWPGEVVIADDGSTDQSVEIIESFAKKYSWIKPIILTENLGVAHATNRALDKASGELILRIDPDDMLMPHRIKSQSEYFESHPETDVLGGNCWYIDARNDHRISRSGFPADSESIEKLFRIGENGVLNGTTMVRKNWFDRFRYRQEMVWAEDYDVFSRMLHAGARFAGQAEPHTLVRIHRGSATSNLQWDTIEKAYRQSIELFNNTRSEDSVRRNFKHLVNYRKFLLSEKPFRRLCYGALAVWYRPDKLLKKVL